MNTTIAKCKSTTWKNLKTHYVAAACVLILATAAVTGFAGTSGRTTLPPASLARSSQPVSVSQRAPSQHTIFIVGSERQAADQQASVFQDIDPSWYNAYSFIVASNADQEAQAQFGLDEAAREVSGVSLRVIDLRTPPMQPLPNGVKSEEARRDDALRLDADIMASVISTELANFVTPAQQGISEADRIKSALGEELSSYTSLAPVARASEADIIASVLSTELASYPAPVTAAKASDADINASVLSTEMATYDFSATSPRQPQALDADIMASVISTEKAAGY